jgi:hypothetical protein
MTCDHSNGKSGLDLCLDGRDDSLLFQTVSHERDLNCPASNGFVQSAVIHMKGKG